MAGSTVPPRRTPLFPAAALLAVVALTACDANGISRPEDPGTDTRIAAPAAAPVAHVPSPPAGVPGVHFLPPMVRPAPEIGGSDTSLLDLLEVEVCAWHGPSCDPVQTFGSTSRGPARLRLGDEGEYRLVWNTRKARLAAGFYRVRVLASGGELGHADVELVDPRSGTRGQRREWVRITRGSSLPIAFVVEEGVGRRRGAEGGTVALADGAVQLQLPPGVLENDVFFTATPVTDLPTGGPPVVPGTAWDFGPDGFTFDEPVVMTIAYDPTALPAGVAESELRIHELVDGEFVQQPAGRVDPVARTVSAEVDGFSVFVVIPRDPSSQQDAELPNVRAVEVFDPTLGGYATTTSVDVSGADAPLTMRLAITDDVSGVSFIDVRYRSPTGRQLRFPCYTGAPPDVGSDTNGEWICTSTVPRYAESGVWEADLVRITDRANNTAFYGVRSGRLCTLGLESCIDTPATVNVISATPDLTPPAVHSIEVSSQTTPRAFGPSLTVDASAGFVPVVFGIRATDDRSGLDNQLPFDRVDFDFAGPSGQVLRNYGTCQRVSGTPVDGFLECRATVPAQAEAGDWVIRSIRVPDRAGNGGFSFFSFFRLDEATGQLCNQTGDCVPTPVVAVAGVGDGAPPELQAVDIAASGRDVITTLALTDDLAGVSQVRVTYVSAASGQRQDCFAAVVSGTPTDGSWSCTIAFPDFAASGQWNLRLEVWDTAGNRRFYFRRDADGFLCFVDPGSGSQVCQDFGDTDLILN